MTELGIKGGTRAKKGEGRCPTQLEGQTEGQEGNGTCDLKSTSTAMGPERLWFSVLGKQRKSLKA